MQCSTDYGQRPHNEQQPKNDECSVGIVCDATRRACVSAGWMDGWIGALRTVGADVPLYRAFAERTRISERNGNGEEIAAAKEEEIEMGETKV